MEKTHYTVYKRIIPQHLHRGAETSQSDSSFPDLRLLSRIFFSNYLFTSNRGISFSHFGFVHTNHFESVDGTMLKGTDNLSLIPQAPHDGGREPSHMHCGLWTNIQNNLNCNKFVLKNCMVSLSSDGTYLSTQKAEACRCL